MPHSNRRHSSAKQAVTDGWCGIIDGHTIASAMVYLHARKLKNLYSKNWGRAPNISALERRELPCCIPQHLVHMRSDIRFSSTTPFAIHWILILCPPLISNGN